MMKRYIMVLWLQMFIAIKITFFEKILLKLGEEFITDTDVQNLAGVYGDNCLKVSEKELQYILFYIHNNALIRCLEEFKKNKFVPAEEAEKQIKLLNFSLSVEKLVDAIKKVFSNEKCVSRQLNLWKKYSRK